MIIALEGLPGVGKTTTAQMLSAHLGVPAVIESTHNHPFLQSVYLDDARHDLEVELAFALLHASAWRNIDRSQTTVTDFTPVKDLLFAWDTLSDREDLALFEQAYHRLNSGSPPAEVVIYLRASPELALDRVRARYETDSHRHFEKTMELERLQKMERQYEDNRDRLGTTVRSIDLDSLLVGSDSEEQSKLRVLDSVLELL
jgi:deoxyadenosine/deoxycytidine kinase